MVFIWFAKHLPNRRVLSSHDLKGGSELWYPARSRVSHYIKAEWFNPRFLPAVNIIKASRILSKMKKARARLESNAAGTEPECEIHSSHGQRELQERLNNISSLQDLFVKQSQALALIQPPTAGRPEQAQNLMPDSGSFSPNCQVDSVGSSSSCLTRCNSFEATLEKVAVAPENLCGDNAREISPTSVATMAFFDRSCFEGIDKTLDFEEADEIDSSTQSSIEESDSEIQAAINEIRKEASQIDIIMALDQLKTVETELEVTTRALRERSLEADELRLQAREREERISCLELERDLHKADASKLRVDLKTCVDVMFDISAVAGTSTLVEPCKDLTVVKSIRGQGILRPAISPIDSAIPAMPPSAPLDDGHSDFDGPQELGHRGPQQNYYCSSSMTLPPEREPRELVVGKSFPLLGASHPCGIFRDTPKPVSPTRSVSLYSESTRSPIRTLDSRRRNRSFSEVIRSSTEPTSEDEDVGKENRMCGLFRRRQLKRSAGRAKDVAIMRSKIDELHEMMKASLETSEKLRKRLAMISRYYEGIVKKLQEQVVEIKTEKSKLKADCNSKISTIEHEKRVAIIHLENKVHAREREIQVLLKKKVDDPPCTF